MHRHRIGLISPPLGGVGLQGAGILGADPGEYLPLRCFLHLELPTWASGLVAQDQLLSPELAWRSSPQWPLREGAPHFGKRYPPPWRETPPPCSTLLDHLGIQLLIGLGELLRGGRATWTSPHESLGAGGDVISGGKPPLTS